MISVFLFGFLWWSSSWWWWPHIAGCKMFVSLLRAGLTVLVQFFCKMYFLWVSWGCKKNLVQFFLVLPPQMAVFFPEGVPGWPDCQNWGLALNPGKVQCEEITFVFGGGKRLTTFPELRASPQFWKSAEATGLSKLNRSGAEEQMQERSVSNSGIL